MILSTLPIPRLHDHSDHAEDAAQTGAMLLTQSLEDSRLAERVARALQSTGYRVLRDIEVFVDARTVRLVGRVPSFYLKQVAQATALAVPGTQRMQNNLTVMGTH